MQLGKYKDAVADCREALKLKPDYTKVIKRLVQGLIALDDINDAKTCLEQAVQLDESNKTQLVDEIKKVKNLDETQEAIDKAIERQNWSSALYFTTEKLRTCPGSTKLKLDQLEFMMEAGQTENAAKVSQEYFNDMNTNPRYLYLRGMILVNEGRLDQGRKFFAQALKNDPDFLKCQKALKKVKKMDTLKTEAGEHFKAGRYEDAIKGFTE